MSHEQDASQHGRDERDRVSHNRGCHGLIARRAEECRDPEAIGLVEAAHAAGRWYRDADHQHRLKQERSRKRHRNAERNRDRPGLRRDHHPQRERPAHREDQFARTSRRGESTAERVRETPDAAGHLSGQHARQRSGERANPFRVRREYPHDHQERRSDSGGNRRRNLDRPKQAKREARARKAPNINLEQSEHSDEIEHALHDDSGKD